MANRVSFKSPDWSGFGNAILLGGMWFVNENTTMPSEIIQLACTECKRRNYTTEKNKRNTPGRLEKKKFCPFDKKMTVHREVR